MDASGLFRIADINLSVAAAACAAALPLEVSGEPSMTRILRALASALCGATSPSITVHTAVGRILSTTSACSKD